MKRLVCLMFGHRFHIVLKGGRAIGSPTAPRNESVVFDWERRCSRCGELATAWSARQVEVVNGSSN